MIRVFTGSDRKRIDAEVKKILGEDYEVFDGENLRVEDVVNIFLGGSLFAEKRKILLKDLTPARGAGSAAGNGAKGDVDAGSSNDSIGNGASTGSSAGSSVSRSGVGNSASEDFYEEMAKYMNTPHEIVIWETNVSQKKTYKDFVKNPKVEVKKFDMAQKIDMRKVFSIYDAALVDGKRAVKMLEEIEGEQDPYMFFGLLVSQAIKKFEWRQGAKEKRVLKELSKVDMQMKTTTVESWLLVKSFLLRLKTI